MKQLPYAYKEITFLYTRSGHTVQITIPVEHAHKVLPEPYPFHACLLAGGGGEIRVKDAK